MHGPDQPDGLTGEVAASQVGAAAAGVPLVEEKVENVEHAAEALGALAGRRELERLV